MEIIVIAAMLALVVLLGTAVKVYDLKRKREEEAVAAQAKSPRPTHCQIGANGPFVVSVSMRKV